MRLYRVAALLISSLTALTVLHGAPTAKPRIRLLVPEPYCTPGSRVVAHVQVVSSSPGLLSLRVLDEHHEPVTQLVLGRVEPGEISLELKAPLEEGLYYLEALFNSSPTTLLALAREPLPVTREWERPLLVALVWHCHQGVNMRPDGVFHGPWAFVHVYRDEFAPYYRGGAYRLHAELMEKHPGVNATYNLSPSLLWQWLYAVRLGYIDGLSGEVYPPNSSQVRAVREVLGIFSKLVEEGRVEVLTSFFNHPIPGYVVDRYEWGVTVMGEELKWGLAVTREALGVHAAGAWIPEMYFSMKLLKLLARAGIRYTVLDARYHLSRARGAIATPYEPYLLVSGNESLVVFFRDTEISNLISFGIELRDEVDAAIMARRVVAEILARRVSHPGARVVVIAADGENWLLGSPLRAVFLDLLLSYLESCRLIRTTTLSGVLRNVNATRTITWVPSTSWAGGDWVWVSLSENKVQWSLIEEAAEYYERVKRGCGEGPISQAALFALFMALNSDVIHREYVMLSHTEAWSREVEMICRLGAQEANKLLLNHMTPNLSAARATTDCRPCTLSIYDLLPQLAITLSLASIILLVAIKRRRKASRAFKDRR